MSFKSFTETPATVFDKMCAKYPNLDKAYSIKPATLSDIENEDISLQLGFVFELKNKSKGNKESIVYYPLINSFIRYPHGIAAKPISDERTIICGTTVMKTVLVNNQMSFATSFGYVTGEK